MAVPCPLLFTYWNGTWTSVSDTQYLIENILLFQLGLKWFPKLIKQFPSKLYLKLYPYSFFTSYMLNIHSWMKNKTLHFLENWKNPWNIKKVDMRIFFSLPFLLGFPLDLIWSTSPPKNVWVCKVINPLSNSYCLVQEKLVSCWTMAITLSTAYIK